MKKREYISHEQITNKFQKMCLYDRELHMFSLLRDYKVRNFFLESCNNTCKWVKHTTLVMVNALPPPLVIQSHE